jgi:hypothetical protein
MGGIVDPEPERTIGSEPAMFSHVMEVVFTVLKDNYA